MGSVWNETVDKDRKPRQILSDNLKTDVLIIGGGMAGILIAHRLKEAGVGCVVVEGQTIGSGVTGKTTAKITAQHGLIYYDLISRLGIEKARQYYYANTKAIEAYRSLAEKYPCNFEEKTAYVYSIIDRKVLEREARAYHRLGLSSLIEERPPLPFKTVGALGLSGQAQFHPLKLLRALANNLEIYENTFVHKVEGHVAYTKSGIITAKNIVLATHYPLINIPGLYFMKLYQSRSYVLALENAALVDGLYLDEREYGHSFRTYGELLFVGGGDHRSGKKGGGYAELRNLAARAYPSAVEKYCWATQDCMPLDKVPYIGRHRYGTINLFTATGFNKWGMTGSMIASELIKDFILSGKSELEVLFSPQRSMLTKQLFLNLGEAAIGLINIGAPRCSHMGCKLHWNKAEKTWDCSCHGSRFDQSGHLVNNPAKKRIRL